MESPIYKLEKVVQGKEELQDFEGPLDLILFLLSKNKIEIQDIPIALILDQYLAYLDRRKEMDLEVASEFVTMAAHLMYIKTRMLLSLEDEEAKNEMDALIQSLAERQRGEAYARVRRLADYYSYERRGMRLVRMEDTWQLCSAPEYADLIRRAFEIRKPAKLSQPALEVLTIIAYYQPTTRAYVDQIRGVDSAYTVGLLLDRHLIEECGRLQVPGRPRLYRTTKAFLRAFHLNSLDDLPEIPGLEADGQLRLNDDGAVQEPEQ